MKAVLVTYADQAFAGYQAICAATGARFGFDECHSFSPADIDCEFTHRHAQTLSAPRGAGYWLWKPYFVVRALGNLSDGDVLVYTDAAMHFVNAIDPLITALEKHRLDLLILGEGFTEAQYTKRDAFVLMGADKARYVRSPQRFASCFAVRKSPWSMTFVRRYLEFAEDPRILTDQENACGLPNYPEYVAHRHDQSIFSLLSKQEEVPFVVSDLIADGLSDLGGQILNHTRNHFGQVDIVRHLLIQGVLSPNDLPRLTESLQKPPLF